MLLNDRVMVYLDIDDCYLDTVGDVYIGTVDSKFSDGSVTVDGMYFIGPITLNEQLPVPAITWPGCYYPKAEGKKE